MRESAKPAPAAELHVSPTQDDEAVDIADLGKSDAIGVVSTIVQWMLPADALKPRREPDSRAP